MEAHGSSIHDVRRFRPYRTFLITAVALGLATTAVLLAMFQLGTGEPWHAAVSYAYTLIVDHWVASLLGAAYLLVVLFVLARMTSR